MDSAKSKPYFIELYSSKDNSLLNKYKFVLSANKVNQLKDLVQEKLITKNQLTKDSKLSIKDVDDFELASDDEVEDVVPDGKIRIYVQEEAKSQLPNPENVPQKIDKHSIQPQQPPQQQPISNPPTQSKVSGPAINFTQIDVTTMTVPKV